MLLVIGRSWCLLSVPRASSQPTGAQNQAVALRAEGVTVTTGPLGELMVDFAEYGWFPKILPSEAADEDEVDDEGDDMDNSA